MKVGDLIRVKKRFELGIGRKGWGTGIITNIARSEMNDDGSMAEIVTVMFGNSIEDILPRYIEVISGCR